MSNLCIYVLHHFGIIICYVIFFSYVYKKKYDISYNYPKTVWKPADLFKTYQIIAIIIV